MLDRMDAKGHTTTVWTIILSYYPSFVNVEMLKTEAFLPRFFVVLYPIPQFRPPAGAGLPECICEAEMLSPHLLKISFPQSSHAKKSVAVQIIRSRKRKRVQIAEEL